MAISPYMQQRAVESRKGKASPRKAQGRRRRLAEKPRASAPWWHHRAYFLRTDPKHQWSYQRIADELCKTMRQVYVALNRERKNTTDRDSAKRNRQEISRRTMARKRAVAPDCEVCGDKMADKYVQRPYVCGKCRKAKGDQDLEAVHELFLAGWTLNEIDKHLGRPLGSAGALVAELRRRGVDLPFRRQHSAQPPPFGEGPPCVKCGRPLAQPAHGKGPPVHIACRPTHPALLALREAPQDGS